MMNMYRIVNTGPGSMRSEFNAGCQSINIGYNQSKMMFK